MTNKLTDPIAIALDTVGRGALESDRALLKLCDAMAARIEEQQVQIDTLKETIVNLSAFIKNTQEHVLFLYKFQNVPTPKGTKVQ